MSECMLGSDVRNLSELHPWGQITSHKDVELGEGICVCGFCLSHVGTITNPLRVVNPFFEISFPITKPTAPSAVTSSPKRTPMSRP